MLYLVAKGAAHALGQIDNATSHGFSLMRNYANHSGILVDGTYKQLTEANHEGQQG